MRKIILIFILCLNFNNTHSIETKIVHKIQNEIITNIDIKNEFKYLLALNNSLKELNKEKILNITNESIIREKIKQIELLKNYKKVEISKDYLSALYKNMYSRLGLESLSKFEIYLEDYDLILSDIEKKITIDAMWNQLIIKKYASQITINKEQIKKEIIKNQKIQSKEYQLSEIIFDIKNKEEIETKYSELIKSINEIGFKNSASLYSFAESSKNGGDIGWINLNSLSGKIKENVNSLKIGEISKPLILSNGVLVLKLMNTRNSLIEADYESKFTKAVNYERNRQLNQYSKIYYNKIKKNLEFDG